MSRRPVTRADTTGGKGSGMFRGNVALPQDLGASARRGMWSSTAGAPGLRVAHSRASARVYTGTGHTPQQFIRQQGGGNNQSSLDATPKINARRTVGAFRGLPSQAPGGSDD